VYIPYDIDGRSTQLTFCSIEKIRTYQLTAENFNIHGKITEQLTRLQNKNTPKKGKDTIESILKGKRHKKINSKI